MCIRDRVRRKLGAEPGEPGRIKTLPGIGYLLDVEPGDSGPARPDETEEPDDSSALIG